jgi:hypothetical protein
MFFDIRSSSETTSSLSEPASRLVTRNTPTHLPLRASGIAAAAPTWLSATPLRQASERTSFK